MIYSLPLWDRRNEAEGGWHGMGAAMRTRMGLARTLLAGIVVVLAGLPAALAIALSAPLMHQLTVAFPEALPLLALAIAPLIVLAWPALDGLLPWRC